MEETNNFELSKFICFENISECLDNFESNVDDKSSIPLNNPCLSYDNIGSENLLPFPLLRNEIVLSLVKRESEHLPHDDYLERLRGEDINLKFRDLNLNMNLNLNGIRREAIEWMWKATAYYGFGPCIFSLAVNYLDRFLSVYKFERGHPWSVQLLALACLSIAAKLEESQILPKSIDFKESMFVFETKGIKTMELLVLGHLNWKMYSSTPCSFVDYFLSKITSEQQFPSGSSMLNSVDLILEIPKCIDFLEFKPSEIAAATAICVSKELEPNGIDEVLTRFAIVEKDKILKCLELMKNLGWMEDSSDLSSINFGTCEPESPIGVLDSAWQSSKCDEITTDGLYPNSSPESSHASKRHKSFHDDGAF